VQCGYHVTEFLLIIKNQGLVKQEFHEITLRARGIERGTAPALWDGREPRLAFPLKIFQEPDVIYRRKYGHVFVEPGVVQTGGLCPGTSRIPLYAFPHPQRGTSLRGPVARCCLTRACSRQAGAGAGLPVVAGTLSALRNGGLCGRPA
jgi:hypothetical protein